MVRSIGTMHSACPLGALSELTPSDLKSIRQKLGLSGAEFARLLGYEGADIRNMMSRLERGDRTIREPQRRLAEAYRDGYRPIDWPGDD